MRCTLGISELQSRQTSGVQAMRCARVPCARLAVEESATAIAIINACRTACGGTLVNQCFMTVLPFTSLSRSSWGIPAGIPLLR
jgi:hypothetical protein